MKRLLLSTLAAGALVASALTGTGYAAAPTPGGIAQAGHQTAATDTTAPGPVLGLTVSDNAPRSISLEWTNPKNADLAHVLVRRAVGDQPPLSASDGTLVAVLGSRATHFTDRQLDSATTYSYAVYTTDRQQNLSTASTSTALTRTTNDRTGVKGVLTDKQGGPIAGAWAEVRVIGSGDFAGQATTGPDGSWRVTNIPPGTYTVCYETTSQTHGSSPTGYLPGCYRQQPFGYGDSGTPVTVTAGKMTTGIRDYLSVAGAIGGRITDPAGAGIGNVQIYVVYPYGQFFTYSATSAANGRYTITGLPADSYQICFYAGYATGAASTGYLDECYDNLPAYYYGGTPIPVAVGHTTPGINATLAVGAAVTGKVTDPAGKPVPDVSASVLPSSGQGLGATDAQGIYRITGIAPGTYSVCFDGTYAITPGAPYGYSKNCADHGAEFQLAAGQTVTRNGTVQVAGALGGSVVGPDGSPVAGVLTNVFDSNGDQINGTNTDENGTWQIQGLAPGQYTVCYDPTYTSGGYRRGCYDAQPNGTTTGTPVTVAAAQLTTVNGSLELGAAITGTVTDSTGTPLGGVAVLAVSPPGSGSGYYYGYTDDTGSYTLGGVDAGDYLVCFDASSAQGPAPGGYRSECYDNQPSIDTADPVTVGDTGTVTVNAELGSGGAIAGRVTDPNGVGVSAVDIVATSMTSGENVYASSDFEGYYTVPGLSSGDYTVCFYTNPSVIGPSTGYVQQCWQGQEIPFGGTAISVGEDGVTDGIDAQLSIGGEITGTVTDAAGMPVPDAYVSAQDTDGVSYNPTGFTNSSGGYVLTGLPAKPMVVCFEGPYTDAGTAYQSQCYLNAPDSSTATPITPTSGEITDGIDAVLQKVQ
ncbi:carboxypeptidase regulatory-like domain-containing protein [Jatrophihabitans sp.]|uniref:carboxypeptidase regulatory-like domain-containing protein n=1 Tax=Jatrophihabitans sp. TaxID=1932789 RepID=UPI002EE683FB